MPPCGFGGCFTGMAYNHTHIHTTNKNLINECLCKPDTQEKKSMQAPLQSTGLLTSWSPSISCSPYWLARNGCPHFKIKVPRNLVMVIFHPFQKTNTLGCEGQQIYGEGKDLYSLDQCDVIRLGNCCINNKLPID